ncbi:restriction endonuclease subunit S [Burkholderia gladioli]|uniref:restriction endonuclease subunit S n=1 Tax=Burkholderia gladioli TaxID=28095 RepID=UPI001FC86236|nr:restriction endonuclease subunit S [Burkholderia gladioli]
MKPWRSLELGNVVTFQRGFDLPHRLRKMGGVPIVSSAGVTDHHDVAMVSPPGVVTGRYGTIGELFYLEEPFWPLNTTLFVRDFHGNDPRFAFYLLHLFDFQVFSGKSGVPGVNRNDLHAERVTIPTDVAEQSAIASALNDVDALLSSLDALIAKKRDIKQAAMQQLLTEKTRLPGFEGEWLVKSIEQCADCLDNVRVPLNDSERSRIPGDYPYCGANGVLDFVNDFVIDDDIILMAEDGGYFDEYRTRPIAYRMNGKCWVNNHAHILKAKEEVDQGFLFYSLVHKNILNFLASGTRAKLNKSEMLKIEVSFPPMKAEQTAIAEVLSDMDGELATLEARRDKTHLLKRGMMQELLTGKTRLV